MMAAGGGIITFIFNGENSHDITRDITHLIIDENIAVIPARLFWEHPNLVEVYCHAGVTKIEHSAFYFCRSLRRVIIPGVTIIDEYAFSGCYNLIHVECDKLERIGDSAFTGCKSLNSINLPSARTVGRFAFSRCPTMTEGLFGKDLECFDGWAFRDCSSLQSVTFPLRNGLFRVDDIFKRCVNLKRVDLVEGEVLHDFADALLFEDWRNDMNEVLDSINQILPNTDPGSEYYNDNGGKAIAIREWIESVLRKVTYYKTVHRELLNEAAAVLQLSLSSDAVINNILPFVELPAHIVFDGEDEAE